MSTIEWGGVSHSTSGTWQRGSHETGWHATICGRPDGYTVTVTCPSERADTHEQAHEIAERLMYEHAHSEIALRKKLDRLDAERDRVEHELRELTERGGRGRV